MKVLQNTISTTEVLLIGAVRKGIPGEWNSSLRARRVGTSPPW